jgi:5-methyltetrahydropteroyltriglutamate--homocysteine methyltransferase
VIDNTSYRESFELYLHALRGDVWTVEMTDRDFAEIELFGAAKGRLPKKIAVGAVSHRTLQCDRPEDVAARIRRALEHIAPSSSSSRATAASAARASTATSPSSRPRPSRRGTNLVRRELGLPETRVPAADARLQTDIVPKAARLAAGGVRARGCGRSRA